MAKKKKKDDESSEPKEKKTGLFDLLSYITEQKKPWNDLTIEEQKAFSPYIINRFLSMDLFLCEAINDLQKYTLLIDKKDCYNLYLNLLPQQRFYLKYVKSSVEIPEKDINCLKRYFNCSQFEAEDYFITLSNTEEGLNTLDLIKNNYIYSKEV